MLPAAAPSPLWRWDLFCRVVDNFGDVGVAWRLAADLAARRHAARLWVDDASALAWMAPGGAPGVEVRAWADAADGGDVPGDVVVELFGCDPPDPFLAAMAARPVPPTWINLEYLSAEDYVERSHGLRSPQNSGPGRGLDKWFFYPGFTAATGGLLREPGLAATQAGFDPAAWLAAAGLSRAPGERLCSLFCYPDADIGALLDALARGGERWVVATAPGAASAWAQAIRGWPAGIRPHALPWLPQPDYDRLLWAADLNVVRGEDSFVRAQWAGKPFLWQIYRQEDGAHADKLQAFLARQVAAGAVDAAQPAQAAWLAWQRAWNGVAAAPAALDAGTPVLPAWGRDLLADCGEAAGRWRAHLRRQTDLVSALIAFIQQKR